MKTIIVLIALALSMYGEPKPPIKPAFKNDSYKIQIYDFKMAHPDGYIGDNVTQKNP